MKKNILKTIFVVLLVFTASINIASAQSTISCKDSFAPRFICEKYVEIFSEFSISSIINLVFTLAQAALVIFVLWQITKAIFKWVNKSSDDKEKAAAITAIVNACIGIFVLVVLLFIVPFFADILGIGGKPNPLYACFESQRVVGQGIVDPDTATFRDGRAIGEYPDTLVYEGTPAKDASNTSNLYNFTKSAFGSGKADDDIRFMQEKLHCRDKNTGKEVTKGYVIVKRVGIKR